jgi:hypothetical protein
LELRADPEWRLRERGLRGREQTAVRELQDPSPRPTSPDDPAVAGTTLTNGAVGPRCTRCDAPSIEAYFETL